MATNTGIADNGNDIMLTGMGGRFPMSDNTDEFAKNLFDGIDMVTDDDSRWPSGLYDMSSRMGRIENYKHFDSSFFGLMDQMVETVDPQSRILLETSYEAMLDAGVNPQELRGSNTGVYVGLSIYAMTDGYPEDAQPDSRESLQEIMLQTLSNMKTFYSSRISFVNDFRGPSLIVDTACSASMSAFTLAYNDLKLGNCDAALVCGAHMVFEPFINQYQQELGVCSPRGVSAVLDQTADGFVKAETVSCVFLQRRKDSRRIYAQVRSSRMNIDGNKKGGMFFPSAEAQEDLMRMTYTDAKINPADLTFFETHSTGTKAGDPQEIKAIYNAYCQGDIRKGKPLPIGALKSNMGHAEAGSGVAAIVKTVIAYENECIPPNMNMTELKDDIKTYFPPLMAVTEKLPYVPGLAGVNNFGIGGANAHALFEPNYRLATDDSLLIAQTIPRIVNICGRTPEAVKHIMDFIEQNPEKITRDFLALLEPCMKFVPTVNSSGMPHRGSMIIKKVSEDLNGEIKYEYRRQLGIFKGKTLRPLWILFPGLGGQWPAMAKALMPIKIFADKVSECHQILSEFGIDLKDWLLSEDKSLMSTMTAKFCSTTAIEIALYEVIKAMDITPDGIIGHSFGEIACAYADGCLTTREAMIVTYFRGQVTESDKEIPKGLMAVVGLPRAEARKLCPNGVYIACNNAKDNVVVSGPEKEMKQMIETLEEKAIFVRQLESSEIPYHSQYLQTSAQPMIDKIKQYIPEPRVRSPKWMSTSVMGSDLDNEVLKLASAEYFVHNLMNPVNFYDKLKDLPEDSIVLELGPHSVFQKVVTDTLSTCTYVALIKKGGNDTNLDTLLSGLATLYELGLNLSINNLYPKVEWPVARGTQSINSLIRWDHQRTLQTVLYPRKYCRSTASDFHFTVDVGLNKNDLFYLDHAVDGNAIFPATGYLMLAWRKLAASLGKLWYQTPVLFESIQLKRAVFITDVAKTVLTVKYFPVTGEFVVMENDNICVQGKIQSPDDDVLLTPNKILEKENQVLINEYSLDRKDIYKELGVIGLDYGPGFQRLRRVRSENFKEIYGTVEWTGNFITYLDAMLQSMAFTVPFRKLMVPVMIRALRVDPRVLFEAVKRNRNPDKPADDGWEGDDDNINKQEANYQEQLKNEAVIDLDDKHETMDIFRDELAKRKARFCIFSADVPFYFNAKAKRLVSYGIEIEDIMAFPIPRRMDTTDLVIDTYDFYANEDVEAVDPLEKRAINQYIETCKAMAAKVKQLVFKEQMRCDFNYQSKSDETIQEFQKTGNNENYILFKIFDKILNESLDENKNLKTTSDKDLQKLLNDVQTNPDYDLTRDLINQINKNERLVRSLVDIVCENFVTTKQLKVTEINLTTGSLAKEVDQIMTLYRIIPFEIEYKLLVKSKQDVHDNFKSHATEWDPLKDELSLKPSHLVILRDTLDLWQLDLEKMIQDIYDSIQSSGFLLTVFRYRFTEPELAFNSLNGKLSRLSNKDLEKRIQDFKTIADSVGLRLVCTKYDTIGTCSLLFRQVINTPEVPISDNIIEITGSDYHKWFEILQQKLITAKEADNQTDTVWLLANDSSINGIIGLVNCMRLEPGGENFRYIFNYSQDNNINNTKAIDFTRKPYSDILANDLIANVVKDGKVGTYRHIKIAKDSDKVMSNEYYLNLGHTHDLAGLTWYDKRQLKLPAKQCYDFHNNPVTKHKINIYSTGLSFHDVLLASGRIPSGPEVIFLDCTIGGEFAGRRADTGERVMGMEAGRCYASSIYASENCISPVPDHWSMDDAVSILSTLSTAYYALIRMGRLKKGESVLIHSAAGGVGQVAINICKHYECDLYVTCGTDDKREFLQKEYGIPPDHIFNSRDILFKTKLMELTEGRGVDVVLNSLSGDKLDASYQCVANHGRFLEMGRYDMVQNKKLGMFDFVRNIDFISVVLDLVMFDDPTFLPEFFAWVHANCRNGCVKPINQTVFKAPDAEKAFRHMTTGKHTGKILINVRDEEPGKLSTIKVQKPVPEMCVTVKTYFDPNKVYIITGGLGGFGMELVPWMQYYGARKFLVTSRSGIKTDYQKYVYNRFLQTWGDFKYYATEWVVSTADGFTIEGTQKLIEEAEQMGPIGGVFHLALELNDCLIEKLTFEKFCSSIDTKHKIFANLDQLTRQLAYKLDYFVVFSSVTCGKGNGGQSNYSFGNSMCERICEQRRREGLHGLAIQYGPIGDVGVFENADQLLKMSTLRKQRINSCCDVLDKLLAIKAPIVTSYVSFKKQSNYKG